MKLTKRKGFNFFRSYFDVYNELEKDEDKLAFIDALLNRQFLGIIPNNLKGMAKFAYVSQTNSIDSQVKGYEDKTGLKLTPCLPPTVGGSLPPCQQVEEEVEEKGKVEEEEEKPTPPNSFFSIDECKIKYLSNKRVLEAVSENPKNKISIIDFELRLKEFNQHLLENSIQTKEYSDYCSHFLRWHKKIKTQTQSTDKRNFL